MQAESVQLTARDASVLDAQAGGTGENAAVSVGAALATNDIANTLRTAIEGAGSGVTAGSVALLAESSSHITVRTTGGANADTFALGGSVSLNQIANTLDTHVSAVAARAVEAR